MRDNLPNMLRGAAKKWREKNKVVATGATRYDAALEEAADAIEELSKPKWIPVTERLPETGVDVLVKFPQNMAVASIDIGEWVVNSGDGWCTDINLAGGEKNPTYWMPLPQPPKEETHGD